MGFPEGASSIAPMVDRLFWVILWITGFFFFVVQGALLLFVLLYREKSGRKAQYLHGNTLVEIVWTIVPSLILVGLTLASQKAWVTMRFPKQFPQPSVTAEILAEQFAWNIRYHGPDGQWDTSDDITALNQLHLPVGEVALIQLRSKDVIHSFFVPEFRIKQDAVPGLPTHLWIKPTRGGLFEIRCAELCGLGHYRMRGYVTAEPRDQFEKWLLEAKADE